MRRIILPLFVLFAFSQIKASDTLTVRQVFNFNVGDTFDYKVTHDVDAGPASQYYVSYYRYIITGKISSSTSDTLIYPRQLKYPAIKNDTLIFKALDSSIYTETKILSSGYYFSTGHDSNNMIFNNTEFIHTDGGTYQTFTESLGLTYSRWSWGNPTETTGYDDTLLIYYSNGTTHVGTPYYNQPTGINYLSNISKIHLYPNPTSDILHLSYFATTQYPTQLILTDILGQQVYSSPITQSETTHDISKLSKGIYTWRITDNNTIIKTGKIIMQ